MVKQGRPKKEKYEGKRFILLENGEYVPSVPSAAEAGTVKSVGYMMRLRQTKRYETFRRCLREYLADEEIPARIKMRRLMPMFTEKSVYLKLACRETNLRRLKREFMPILERLFWQAFGLEQKDYEKCEKKRPKYSDCDKYDCDRRDCV